MIQNRLVEGFLVAVALILFGILMLVGVDYFLALYERPVCGTESSHSSIQGEHFTPEYEV